MIPNRISNNKIDVKIKDIFNVIEAKTRPIEIAVNPNKIKVDKSIVLFCFIAAVSLLQSKNGFFKSKRIII